MIISVVIPTYKKKEMFLTNLRRNTPYLKDQEVIVVNDDPSESIASIRKEFNQLKLLENTHNMGFAGAIHTGIMATSHDFVVLLNSDVELINDSFKKSLTIFAQDPQLFAISFLQQANHTKSGKNKLIWDRGFLIHDYAPNLNSGITGWAEGGACIIDKKKYVQLGGFNPLYSPFYWEDVDLSYRAWKAGYTVRFEPSIEVIHHHESTIGSLFKRNYIKKIAYRNQLLCIWLNITSLRLRLSHCFFLIKRLIVSLATDIVFIQAYFEAVQRYYSSNHEHIFQTKRSDEEIVNYFIHE